MDEEVNPFQSPTVPVEVARDDELDLDYWRPISFAFDSPKWMTNTLLLGVAQFIPIVGPLVMMGYQYEVVISLLRQPAAGCPEFDFNRFGDYLRRGVMPFLVALLFGFVMGFFIWIVMAVGMVLAAAAAQGASEEAAAAIMMVFFGIFIVAIFAFSIFVQMLIMPLALQAGLTKDFSAGMKLGYAFQFLRNCWVEMIMFGLVIALAGMVAVMVGLLIFCIGQYFLIGIVFVAQAHAYAQLYRLNCTRGGEVIPIVD